MGCLLVFFIMTLPLNQLRVRPWAWFDQEGSLGDPQHRGAAHYQRDSFRYRICGGCRRKEDSAGRTGHFLWREVEGDFIAYAEVALVEDTLRAGPEPQIGWLTIPDLADAAQGVEGFLTEKCVDKALQLNGKQERHCVLQVERNGNEFQVSRAFFGDPLLRMERHTLNLPKKLSLGLFVGARQDDGPAMAVFRNVRIVRPAPVGLIPYRDYLGSYLELLDLGTGKREIVYSVPDSLQAPNWTPDGRKLIFNRNGLLYCFNLQTEQISEIDTGFARDNNNDHVLSFDGNQLGISHHNANDGGRSHIYTLPAKGGLPKQITQQGPSYLHGWSPDGRYLIYTAGRGGRFNIYRIPAEGGQEEALTDTDALNDGAEYAPDGKSILFNSARSGRMQIWRMGPGGEDPVQLTDDIFNNWFPHFSRRGREVVFLSYLENVDPTDHPFYQQVYLRVMPADGGEPKVVAYLYGGQGTINVPSWSPDGRRCAFVSNTGME